MEMVTLQQPAVVQQRGLCERITDRRVRVSCQQVTNRPHLWEVRDPGGRVLDLDSARRCLGDCDAGLPLLSCAIDLGMLSLAEGSLAQPCDCLGEGELASECHFQVAERVLTQETSGSFGTALAQCVAAADYRRSCLSHVLETVGSKTPSMSSWNGPPWREAVLRAEQFRKASSSVEPPMVGAAWNDVYWAVLMRHASPRGCAIPPELTALLPPEAMPHLRAALAWWFVGGNLNAGWDLEAWDRAFEQALAGREGEGSSCDSGGNTIPSSPSIELGATPDGRCALAWRELGPDRQEPPSDIPCISFFGETMRPSSSAAEVDRMLAILEAVARRHPSPVPLLEQALLHDAPSVRWSARRLLRDLEAP